MRKPNEGRLEAIAFNALQESRKAHGVGDMPWSDKDARLQAMITKVLGEVQTSYTENDVGKITPEVQVSMPKPLIDVESLLDKIESDEPVPVPAKRIVRPV